MAFVPAAPAAKGSTGTSIAEALMGSRRAAEAEWGQAGGAVAVFW